MRTIAAIRQAARPATRSPGNLRTTPCALSKSASLPTVPFTIHARALHGFRQTGKATSLRPRLTSRQPTTFFLVRSLSGKPLPQSKSKALNFIYRAAAWIGITLTVVGAGVVGFFIYDASTYKEHATHSDINVDQLA